MNDDDEFGVTIVNELKSNSLHEKVVIRTIGNQTFMLHTTKP